jgi:hypothetical protein
MADRPYQNLSDKMLSETKKILGIHTKNSPIIRSHKEFNDDLNKIIEFSKDPQKAESQGQVEAKLKGMERMYGRLITDFNLIKDAEDAINRIERQAAVRAVITRLATTLVIGLSIVTTYGLAQWLEIDLPLSRLK